MSQAAFRGLCPKCLLTSTLKGGALAGVFARRASRPDLPRAWGNYELIQEVARGGMGVVYKARQLQVNRIVAVKVLAAGQFASPDFVKRFRTEAEAVANLEHPNIVPIYEIGECEGQPFFSMRLVEGRSLAAHISELKSQISNRQAAELLTKLARAVHYAHQRGILHRDIKPGNVLLDAQGEPHLTDFGLAKLVEKDSTLTRTMAMLGTPSYMSPEQARGDAKQLTTGVDVYGLGAVFYELLTGQPPFAGGTTMETVRQVLEKEPRRPSTLQSGLDRDLETICLKCLEKDPTRRYLSADALAADLQRWREHEPILARPASAVERVTKWIRRHQVGFAALVTIALLLVAGGSISTWQTVRATKAEALARQQRTHAETERQRAETNSEKFRNASILSRRSQYAADMFAATAEIEKGSYGNARNFLREYLPHEGLEELRGFEWRYLWQLSAGQQLKTFPVTGEVIDAAWSPDGRWIAASSSDRTVKLLDADTGEARIIFTNSAEWNASVAFSYDGNRVAAVDRRLVCLWDVRDGRLVFTLTNFVSARVACSPAGPLMAVGTGGDWWGQSGSNVYLVDVNSGKEVRLLPNAGDRAVFSRDGKRLATANGGWFYTSQSVILWDVDSGQKLHVFEDKRQVLGMAFSPDGSLLAIGTRHGDVTLWNLNDLSHSTLREATGDFARSVAFSPDGRWLAVAMLTQEVEIWDVQERRLVERLRGHTWEVNAVAYSPDGSQLASGSRDGTIRFWEPHPPTLQKLLPGVRWEEREGFPTFSADSRWLAVPMKNGDVQIVDATTDDWSTRTVLTKAGLPLAFSRDASTLLTLETQARTLRHWKTASKAVLSTTRLETTNVTWVISSVTPDGNLLALANLSLVEVFETGTGRCVDRMEYMADSIEFSRDGRLLALGINSSCVLRDIAKRRFVWQAKGHRDRIFGVRFSPDQKIIATASWDSNVRLWDATMGKELAVLTGHKAPVLNTVFSPDGRTLATKSDDRTIKFWSLATFREVASIPLDYTGTTQGHFLAFSPDGQILVANDSGPGFRCWRAPTLAVIDAAEAKKRMQSKQP